MSHADMILADLKRGRKITPISALEDYGCFRLGARVYDLKRKGTGMLKAAVRAHILFHADQLKEAVVADTELRSLEDEGRAQVVAMRDAYEQIFRDIIEEGQRTGEFRDVDAHLATRALLGAITDVANWFRPRGGLSLDEISDQYCSVFLQGISNPTPKPNRKKPSR